MAKLPKISALWAGRKIGEASAIKPAWGMHSHTLMLAEGWAVGENSICRNGVVIAWKGSLTASSTSVTVEMNDQRFPTTSNETRKHGARLGEFLKAGNSG